MQSVSQQDGQVACLRLCAAPAPLWYAPRSGIVRSPPTGAICKGQHLGANRVSQLVAFFDGKHLHLTFHEGVQDAHDLKQQAAQAAEFRDDQDIARLHGGEQRGELALGELLRAADRFFHPGLNHQPLRVGKLQQFVALVFDRLPVGRDAQVGVDYRRFPSLSRTPVK